MTARRLGFYSDSRRSGKTTACIEWFLEDPKNRKIISSSHREAQHTRRMIEDRIKAHVPQNSVLPPSAFESLQGSREFVIDEPFRLPPAVRRELLHYPNYRGASWGTIPS